MERFPWLVAVVLFVAFPSGVVLGQEEDGRRDSMPWSVTPYVGALWLDVDELDEIGVSGDAGIVVGPRLGYRFSDRWELEVGYGYSPLEGESEADTSGPFDGDLHLYHATIGYLLPAGDRSRIRLAAGLGGMRYSYDPFIRRNTQGDEVELVDTSWANELALVLGAGFEFDAGERYALRADVRDHLQFCNAEDPPINETSDFSHCPLDDALLHNAEVTGGLVIRF